MKFNPPKPGAPEDPTRLARKWGENVTLGKHRQTASEGPGPSVLSLPALGFAHPLTVGARLPAAEARINNFFSSSRESTSGGRLEFEDKSSRGITSLTAGAIGCAYSLRAQLPMGASQHHECRPPSGPGTIPLHLPSLLFIISLAVVTGTARGNCSGPLPGTSGPGNEQAWGSGSHFSPRFSLRPTVRAVVRSWNRNRSGPAEAAVGGRRRCLRTCGRSRRNCLEAVPSAPISAAGLRSTRGSQPDCRSSVVG